MSSKSDKETKENKNNKLVYCKNCHQDIESNKMFLHEGFCFRNNVFCDHCEKVFLKKDYKEHKKEIKKNKKINSKKVESSNNSKKSTSNEDLPTIIQHSITTINPQTSLEFVHMPVVEEISINTPIIINEEGNIVSNKNKNEYLLPILGIKSMPNITISNFNYDNDIKRQFTVPNERNINIVNKNKNYDVYNTVARINHMNNEINNEFNYTVNENGKNQEMNYYNNNIEYNDISNDNNNNIIINNNIITYNDNKKISKINNYFKNEETPKKLRTSLSSDNMKQSKDPQDKIIKNSFKKENMIKHPHNKITRLKYNTISEKKEPTDSSPKYRNYKKLYENKNKNKNKNKFLTTDGKNEVIKVCGYCNSIIKDFSHFEICKSQKLNKKRQNEIQDRLLTEILEKENLDEFGIEDNKKKILHREFMPIFHTTPFNKEIVSPQRIIVPNLKSSISDIKKKIFSNNQLFKTQERTYREAIPYKLNYNENIRSVERKKIINLNYKLSPPSFKYNDRIKLNNSNDFISFNDSRSQDKNYKFKKNIINGLNFIRI